MARTTLMLCLTAVVAVAGARAQVLIPPKPIEVVGPVYPDAARDYGIDGVADVRVTVNADGSVASIAVLSVPRPNLGFEEAVEQADISRSAQV